MKRIFVIIMSIVSIYAYSQAPSSYSNATNGSWYLYWFKPLSSPPYVSNPKIIVVNDTTQIHLKLGGVYLDSIPYKVVSTPTNIVSIDASTGKLGMSKSLSLTNTGSGAATYNPSTGVMNIPTPSGVVVPTYNYGVSRTINSTSFTPSTTQPYRVTYNISISCTATIGSAASGKVELQYYNGTTWVTVNEIANSNTVTLAITLNSVNIQNVSISGEFPANTQLRLVPTVAGTTTITYIRGTEILY